MEGTEAEAHAPLVWWSRGAAAVVLGIAVVNWFGWATGIEGLTRVHPDWPPMTPWTAVLLAGLAIAILLQSGYPPPAAVWAGRAVTALTGSLAAVFLAEYVTGRLLGLDQALFSDAVSTLQQTWPGRPSPQTALSVLVLAAAVALLRLDRRWITIAWPLSVVTAVALPAVALAAYLFDAASMVSLSPSTGMSNLTAFAMVLLVAATLAARSDRHPVAWLLARPDRRILVRLVITFAVLPIWVGLWRLVFLAFGLRGDAVWVLSITLATLFLGVTSFVITRRVQRLMIDQLVRSRERAEAERERAEAVERYRILADNTVDVVVHLRDGLPVWVSPSIEPAFGWPVEEWIGADFLPRIHPDDHEDIFTALAANAQGRAAVARFRTATSDGGYRWVEGHGKPYTDVDGNTDGVIIAVRIIEAQVEVERELQQARDSAIALTEAKSDYVATVSHEIRSPIHGILGFAELLENQLSAEGRNEAAEWSRRVRTEAERLTRLIEDLLDLSRLEAGRTKIAVGPFRLRGVVDDVVEMSRLKAEAKGLKLNFSVDPTISDWRLGDADRLHQVLRNLVSNAKKFTREGRIDVEISSVATGAAADLVRFAVTDTGPGIPAEEIDRILQPFAQVRGSDADQGSGLGLAISDGLVKAMGGEGISVASLEGHGSTFHFTVPLPQTKPLGSASGDAQPAGRGSNAIILVVDDNSTNQLLVEAQLAKLGYGCEVASDGAQALESLESGRFDAVLMDCNMPGMDGYEATRRIRARERGTGVHIPVLALTASASGSNRDACERAGMDGFLRKPVLLSDLAEGIGRFVRGGEADGADREAEASCAGQGMPIAPILDDARVDRLLVELGPGPLHKVTSSFIAEMPRRLAELCRVAAEGDAEAVRRSAHALRSPSAMLGAAALAEKLRAVEESTDPVSRLSEARLDDLVAASIEQLRARLGQAVDQEGGA